MKDLTNSKKAPYGRVTSATNATNAPVLKHGAWLLAALSLSAITPALNALNAAEKAKITKAETGALIAHRGEFTDLFSDAPISETKLSKSSSGKSQYQELRQSSQGPIRITRTLRNGQVIESASVGDQLIVGLKDEVSLNDIRAELNRLGYASIDHESIGETFVVINLPDANLENFESRRSSLQSGSRKIDYVEPNYIVTTTHSIGPSSVGANDPRYTSGALWGLDQANDIDIDAPEVWSVIKDASGIRVAVIDSGALISHPDLSQITEVYSMIFSTRTQKLMTSTVTGRT